LGILTTPSEQVIFVDTPGLHVPQHKLGDFMNQEAVEALLDADLILWLLDASEPFVREDHLIAERLNTLKKHPPVLMALTKADLASQETLAQRQKQAVDLYPGEDVLFLSAVNKTGLDELLARIVNHMPVGEPFFSEDTVTDYYERDIAADLIRQSVLQFIRDEVPHCVAIRIDTYEERGEEGAYIEGTIFVERDSQKGIIIGKGGEMIKKIGTQARKEIEEMSGRKVFLSLKTKVNKNWRNDPEALKLMGYNPSTTEE
jgi:GTP-binding protein Era